MATSHGHQTPHDHPGHDHASTTHSNHDHSGHDRSGADRSKATEEATPAATALADRLRERGMRLTAQRERVMAAVVELEHATPEQVAQAVPEVDLTTVYRTLEILEQIGLLAHTHLGHGAPSYRLASDDHVHVVCHHCGAVVDAPVGLVDRLAEQLQKERGFVVDRSHFTVFGSCRDCAAAAAS